MDLLKFDLALLQESNGGICIHKQNELKNIEMFTHLILCVACFLQVRRGNVSDIVGHECQHHQHNKNSNGQQKKQHRRRRQRRQDHRKNQKGNSEAEENKE